MSTMGLEVKSTNEKIKHGSERRLREEVSSRVM